ncbi:MAG: EAL domain-containing protein [Schwartzia sp.]|nr:EAL domain-containing protein [Schwartzia sp. (in: firmicutes)]
MRKGTILAAICFTLGFLFSCAPVAKADAPVIRVGYTDVPGYISKGEDGYFRGFIYDYLEAIAIYSGYHMEFVEALPTECVGKMMRGELDMIAALPDAQTPVPGLATVRHAITYSPVGVVVRQGHSLGPGKGTRIGYASFIYSGADIRKALTSYGLREGSDYTLVASERPLDLISNYQSGNLDAYIDAVVYHKTDDPMVARLFTNRFCIAVRADHTALLEQVNHAVDELMLLNPHIRGQLFSKHAGKGAPLLLTPDEKAYLESHPVISAVASPGQKPYTYFENGKANGVIAELIRRMEEDLGVSFDIRETKNNGELMNLLTNGEIDVVADYFADHNWGHMHNALLTFPYLTINYVPVMRHDRELPKEPRVACVKSHCYIHEYVERKYPAEQLVYFDTIADCMDAVNRGAADVTFLKAITVQHDIEQGNYMNLYTNGSIAFSHQVAFAVSEAADPRLIHILNKEINHLGDTPIEEIVTRRMFEGEQNKSLKAFIAKNPIDSLAFLATLLLSVIGGLIYVGHLREKAAKEAHDIARKNQLTGLPNVRAFEENAARLIKNHPDDRKAGKLFVMVLSTQRMDLLKATLNPEAVARGIRELVEKAREKNPWMLADGLSSELTHLYVLGRLDGGMTLRGAAEKFADDTALLTSQGYDVHMQYDFGLCAVPADGDISVPHLMADADTAQVEAKDLGDYIGIYDEKLQQKRLKQKMISQVMQKALANDEFQIWLQPKYEIRTQKIIGAEALTRWQSPELGFVMPGLFIGVFEKTGFILEFDYYVLESVCKLQRRRIDEGKPVIPFSVNQSGLHIREPDYLDHLRAILGRYHLPPGAIDLEITETAFVDFDTQDRKENSAAIITAMKELGCTVSMDDFCTGYSSIAMLQHLDMDVMKIDRAMLLASEASKRGQKIMRRVVSLGQDLNMLVLCEGVETKEQENLLLENGCCYAQGFLFGKPMPAEKFFAFADNLEMESA